MKLFAVALVAGMVMVGCETKKEEVAQTPATEVQAEVVTEANSTEANVTTEANASM